MFASMYYLTFLIYLTYSHDILRHILGNVARVVGRDASRSSAHVSDLNLALCEDDAMYQLFKTMKGEQELGRQANFFCSRY